MSKLKLSGPRKDPASGQSAKQLIVFLHGYGADGNDLISLSEFWSALLPDAAFVSPHAPEPCAMNPFGGHQWFELTFRDPSEYWRGVNKAAPVLHEFLDQELKHYGLDDASLALVGFSQGTMMSLHAGMRRKKAPAAIIGYSGMMAGPENLAAEVTSKPPVLLVHGDEDEVIPVEMLSVAEQVLSASGISVSSHICKGLGHGIDQDGLKLAGEFLAKAFRQ